MAARTKTSQLSEILDRLEAAYGTIVPTEDAVEAAVLALLAEHAPTFSTVQARQALREAFVDWNEMRVADPWDISHAIGGGTPGTRAFAKAAVKALDSLHGVLNRASFDRAVADPEADVEALVAKMKRVPPHAKAVMLAVLAPDGEWRPDKEVAKVAQKLGLVKKTTSLTKIAQGLAAAAGPDDRLRGHYLLTLYAHRAEDAPDPLEDAGAAKGAAKRSAKAAKKAAGDSAQDGAQDAAKSAKKTAKKRTKKAAKK